MIKLYRGAFALLTLLVGASVGKPALAALGGDLASVQRDHAALRAADLVTPTAHYDLHEAHTADGLTLRQYLDRSGRVFAVTWKGGNHSPDVSALLGEYAARYHAAARAHRGNHHVLSINDPDLTVTLLRLPRGWQGEAVLPAAIPVGVDRAELR